MIQGPLLLSTSSVWDFHENFSVLVNKISFGVAILKYVYNMVIKDENDFLDGNVYK